MVKSMVLRELHTLEETTMDKVRFLMSDTGAPVSYTHLDVYKRQVDDSADELVGVQNAGVNDDGHRLDIADLLDGPCTN